MYALLSYGIIISVMLLLFSCSDSVSTLPVVKKKNFIPIETGNYWVYNTYELNTLNQPIPESQTRDSLVVVGKGEVRGNESYVIHKFVDGEIQDTLYWFKMIETFYYYMDDALIDVPGFRPQFMKMYLPEEKDWHVYDTLFYAYPVDFLGERIDSTETQYTMNAKIIWNDSSDVLGSRRLTRHYQFEGDLAPAVVQRIHLQMYSFHYAENVGIFYFKKSASSINTTANTDKYGGESIGLGGMQSYLVDFHVGE